MGIANISPFKISFEKAKQSLCILLSKVHLVKYTKSIDYFSLHFHLQVYINESVL